MGMLEHKVAFITGAASGIGAGIATRFVAEGARVVLADMQREAGERVRDSLIEAGGQAVFVECDVTSASAVEAALAAAISAYGQIDIVCANAGINGVFAPIDELQPDEWDRTIATNLRSTYLTVHYAVPHLKAAGGGSIIITSSVNGNRTFHMAGASAYSTSKAAQVAFMKMIALELAQHNIRCTAICPGGVRTNIRERTEQRNTESMGLRIQLPNGMPTLNSGRAEPAEIADVALFLASDLSRHVTGVEIFVDGGSSLLA